MNAVAEAELVPSVPKLNGNEMADEVDHTKYSSLFMGQEPNYLSARLGLGLSCWP